LQRYHKEAVKCNLLYNNFEYSKELCRFAVKNLGKKNIAIVYQNDGFGQSALKGVELELNELHMQPAALIPVSSNERNMKVIVQKLKKAAADKEK